MAFADDKAAVLSLLDKHSCFDVDIIDTDFTAYSDIPSLIFQYASILGCDRIFLEALADVIDSASLDSVKVYYGKSTTDVTNPECIINSTYSGDVLIQKVSTETLRPVIAIFGSTINNIIIDGASFEVGLLIIAGGTTVKSISTINGARLNVLMINGCNKYPTEVKMIVSGSAIDDIRQINGGGFGEFESADVSGTCGEDVVSLATTLITHDSLKVVWEDAAETIGVTVLFKKSNTSDWLSADVNKLGVTGNMVDSGNGFVFRGLEPNTYYDFKVYNICENGIRSAGVVVTTKTDRCV